MMVVQQKLKDNLIDAELTLENLRDSAKDIYAWMVKKSINKGKPEPTFIQNLEFEKVPLKSLFAWVEDFADNMHKFNVHTGFKVTHYNPKYEVIQGISHSQDTNTYEEALEKQREEEAEALNKLDQIDSQERKQLMVKSLESGKDALSPKRFSVVSSTNVATNTATGTVKRPQHRSVFSSRSQHQSKEFLDIIPTFIQKELKRIKISNEEEADRKRGYRISTSRRRAPKDSFNRSYDPSKPYTARSLE